MFALPLERTSDGGIRFKYAIMKRYVGMMIPANNWDATRPAFLQDYSSEHLNWGFTLTANGTMLFAGPWTKFSMAWVVFSDKVTSYQQALDLMQSDPWYQKGMIEVVVQEMYSSLMANETVTIPQELEILKELLNIVFHNRGGIERLLAQEISAPAEGEREGGGPVLKIEDLVSDSVQAVRTETKSFVERLNKRVSELEAQLGLATGTPVSATASAQVSINIKEDGSSGSE